MTGRKRTWEIIIGLFVVLGIAVSTMTAIWFVRESLDDSYPVVLHVNDAGGIKQGAPVELGGLEIGNVSEKPYFNKDYTGLLIPLAIQGDIKIPENALVMIDASTERNGSYVLITLPKEKAVSFVEEGEFINGFRLNRDEMQQKAMSDSMAQFQESMKSLDSTSQTLTKLISVLETDGDPTGGGLAAASSQGPFSSVNRSMEAFEKTNNKLSDTIDLLDLLLNSSGKGLKKLDASITKFDNTMDEIVQMSDYGDQSFNKIYELADQNTDMTKDLHLAVNEFRGFIGEISPMLSYVRESEGLMKTLIDDSDFNQSILEFVCKIEKHGFLMYPREKKPSMFRVTKNTPSAHVSATRVNPLPN